MLMRIALGLGAGAAGGGCGSGHGGDVGLCSVSTCDMMRRYPARHIIRPLSVQ
jgi:hypothetical protein